MIFISMSFFIDMGLKMEPIKENTEALRAAFTDAYEKELLRLNGELLQKNLHLEQSNALLTIQLNIMLKVFLELHHDLTYYQNQVDYVCKKHPWMSTEFNLIYFRLPSKRIEEKYHSDFLEKKICSKNFQGLDLFFCTRCTAPIIVGKLCLECDADKILKG